jgi:DNA-binding transcriptional ArsR family regulator
MWFSKKREEEIQEDYREEIARLNSNLKHSFLKIKEDIKAIKEWIDYFESQHQDHKSKFKQVEEKLAQVDEAVSYVLLSPTKEQHKLTHKQEEKLEEEVKEILEQAPTPHYLKLLDDLTETQKTMFYRLAILLKEAGQEWMTMKALATDLYPNKQYDQVRSTTSEYVNVLIESGLLEKRRRGKQTYIGITEKGKQLVKKAQQEEPQKVKSRAKR